MGNEYELEESEETERLIRHIKQYEQDPLVRGVLVRKNSFRNEVENFYDLETWEEPGFRLGTVTNYKLKTKDSNKKGKIPNRLIEIVSPFADEEFDTGKLRYEDVRTDYRKKNTFVRNSIIPPLGALGLMGGVFGATIGFGADFLSQPPNTPLFNPLWIHSLEVGGTGAFSASLYRMFKGPSNPKGTNNELQEYHRLHDSAENADRFLMNTYRDYFIRKNLQKA